MLKSALADIPLFGIPFQVSLAREFVYRYSARKNADVDRLLADLRRELQAELVLEPTSDETFFLRVIFDDAEGSQASASR